MAKKGKSTPQTAAAGPDSAAAAASMPVSFDSELDALFSAAATAETGRPQKPPQDELHRQLQAGGKKRRRSNSHVETSATATATEEEERQAAAEAPGKDADAASSSGGDVEDGDSEDDEDGDDALERRYSAGQQAGANTSSPPPASDEEELLVDDDDDDASSSGASDGSKSGSSGLVHETLARDGSASSAKPQSAHYDVPQADRDARSIFIGNLPLSIATSRPSIKALKRHLTACSPYPSVTRIESIRFRSIPFSTPTDDFTAQNPVEAEKGARKRQRTLAHKEARNEAAGDQKKVFLSGSQKRKVAFIRQEVNERADGLNAYVTLTPLPAQGVAALQASNGDAKTERLSAPVLAALLAASADGSIFEDRHLRTDLVMPLSPAEIVEAGLDRVKTSDGTMLGTSVAAGKGVDFQARQKTVFVGNMDFETKEEELRAFFHSLLESERGVAPEAERLDFTQCPRLPAPDVGNAATAGAKGRECSWVRGVRIVRDAATQMGKGFGYVRFCDAECVDEVIALSESEQAFLAAAKAGQAPSTRGEFRRKLKFKGRPLRVSRCKAPKGHVTSSRNGAAATPVKASVNGKNQRSGNGTPVRDPRSRSTGAPTPGGTSPFARRQAKSRTAPDSPTRQRARPNDTKANASEVVANPKPMHSDPFRTAQVAQKKLDPARQAKRLAKKNAKRVATKAEATDKLSLKPKASSSKAKKGGKHREPTSPTHKKPSRSLFTALAAIVAILALVAVPAQANNEIINFGPLLCEADEVGHLTDKAARNISQAWPLLSPTRRPRLFSVNAVEHPEGVWLVLSLETKEEREHLARVSSALETTPQELVTASFPLLSRGYDTDRIPRDRWLHNTYQQAVWFCSKRFSFRVNWAANFPLRVSASVHTPDSMLAQGGARYRANDEEVAPGDLEHVPRLAGGTDPDNGDVPQWPCPRLYVHLAVVDEGVAIPPRPREQSARSSMQDWAWKAIVTVAEGYLGPLAADPRSASAHESSAPSPLLPIPLHIVWEPLHAGAIPSTAMSLLVVLVPALVIAYLFIIPPSTRGLATLIDNSEDEGYAGGSRRPQKKKTGKTA